LNKNLQESSSSLPFVPSLVQDFVLLASAMLKLKKLQQEKEKAKAATEAAASSAESTTTVEGGESSSNGTAPGGYVLKKTNSKELLRNRKSKSKENVMSLRSNTGRKKEKTKAVELRVQKDVGEIGNITGCEVDFPDPNNLMLFIANVTPSDGLYAGATFKFQVTIPPTYPYDPPKVECQTLVYHPNIDFEGHVCLNILRADWMPVLNLWAVLMGLVHLFREPNPDDPLNKDAAQLMIDRPSEFENNVKRSLQGGYFMSRQFPKLK
jgi:ubiquitin-conjugating enzyme E2 M